MKLYTQIKGRSLCARLEHPRKDSGEALKILEKAARDAVDAAMSQITDPKLKRIGFNCIVSRGPNGSAIATMIPSKFVGGSMPPELGGLLAERTKASEHIPVPSKFKDKEKRLRYPNIMEKDFALDASGDVVGIAF